MASTRRPWVTIPQAVSHASEDEIISAGAKRIGTPNTAWPFLPATSSILDRKALTFVEALYNRNPYTHPSRTEVDELADYLVLSMSTHMLTGWRYLSQAAIALLSGSRSEALHLAYYAELRAAMSILAGSGVGIMKKDHFILTSAGSVEWFTGNTHPTAWESLTEWSRKSGMGLTVLESLATLNVEATDWATAFGISTKRLDEVAENWIKNWSIDLSELTKDRERRNQASYRPDLRQNIFSPLLSDELRFLQLANAACTPVGDGSFYTLDTALIFDLYLKAYQLSYGDLKLRGYEEFRSNVIKWLVNNKGMNNSDAESSIIELLKARRAPGGNLIASAHIDNDNADGVFARAFLLLRLAAALYRTASKKIRKLRVGGKAGWQEEILYRYGVNSHLFDDSGKLSSYDELDQDQVEAQEDLKKWFKKNSGFNAYALWRENAGVLHKLCRLERVGIMAVAL